MPLNTMVWFTAWVKTLTHPTHVSTRLPYQSYSKHAGMVYRYHLGHVVKSQILHVYILHVY